MIRRQHIGQVLFCLLVIGWAVGLGQARPLSPRQAKKPPRARLACIPSPTMGVRYLDADDLGRHDYRSGHGERNGIVYTCRGGHIDITHLRKIADWSAFLAYHGRDALVRGDREFRFKMYEPSRHCVQIEYPPGWDCLSEKTKRDIADRVSPCLGAHLAYTCSIWHEILTWYGYKGIGFYPEYNSAFSWEDNYSNVLGSRLGARAVQDAEHDYDEAMALQIAREMRRLGPQPRRVAEAAGEAVRGSWFVGAFVRVTMTKRHLDVGLDDGFVTPWLVPNVAECGPLDPWLCPVPDLSLLEDYGFHIRHEIHPREWERGAILRAVYPDRHERKNLIVPAEQFPDLIEHIKTMADRRYGPYAHLWEDPSSPLPRQQLAQLRPYREASAGASDLRAVTASREAGQDRPVERRSWNPLDVIDSAVSWLASASL